MIPEVFLELIEKTFNEEEKQVLVASLLQDARISKALDDIQRSGNWDADRLKIFENWKPVYFAFLLQDARNGKKDLKDLVQHLPVGSNQLLSNLTLIPGEPLTLQQAGEKALQLQAILQTQIKNWHAIEEEYFSDFQFQRDAGLVATCLLGLVERPDDFIEQGIICSPHFEIKKLMCYALLCNAQPLDDLLRRLHMICDSIDEEERIDLLRFMQQQGRGQLVRALIPSDLQIGKSDREGEITRKLSVELQEIQTLNFASDLQLLAGNVKTSQQEIERLIQKIDQLRQAALQKKSALSQEISIDRIDGKTRVVPNKYDWKSVPARLALGELKRPSLDEIDDVLCTLENNANMYVDNEEMQIKLADYYADLGDWKRAQNHLRIAQILDPGDPQITEKLLHLFIKNQHWDLANSELKLVLKTAGFHRSFLPFYIELKTLLADGRKEEVLQRLRGYPLETLAKDPHALFQAGTLFMDLAEWERAASFFEAAIAEGSTDFSNWITLYRCLVQLQQLQKADKLLSEAMDLFGERKGFYEQLIPVLMDSARTDQGLALIDKIGIDGANPSDIAAIIERLIQRSYQVCAYEIANKALERFPLHASLGYQTACVLLENGEHERAAQLLRWSADEKKNDPQYLTLKAVADLHSRMTEFPMGTDEVDVSRIPGVLADIQKIPATDYWRNLIEAEGYRLQGELNKATEAYKKIILDNSLGENRAQLWRAQVGLAKTMLKANQVETAITLLNEALRTQIDNLGIYDLLSEAYRSCDLGEDALQIAKQARLVCKKQHDITGWYVAQMLKLGKSDEARKYFQQEEENLQSSPAFLFERMKFEHRFGNADQTISSMQDLMALEKLSFEQLYTALEIAEELKQHELSLKIVQKLPKDNSNQAEMLFIESCIMWNDGDHAGAMQHLQPIKDEKDWNEIDIALNVFYAFQEQAMLATMEVILQVLDNIEVCRSKVATLPAHIRDIIPMQWLPALTEPQYWMKMAMLNLLEQPVSEGQYTALLSIIETIQIDALSNGYLLICNWMRSGKLLAGRDWVNVLDELEEWASADRDVVIGMILNILMDEGNEIAVAEKLNAFNADRLSEKGISLAKARLLNRNGNKFEALQLYGQALGKEEIGSAPVGNLDVRLHNTLSSIPFWLAKSALELMQWQDAAAAFAQCLPHTSNLVFLKKGSIEGLLKVCLNGWGYPSIEVVNEFPDDLYSIYRQTLHDHIDLLPVDLAHNMRLIMSFLDGEELPDLLEEKNAQDYLGRAVRIIQGCRMKDIQSVIAMVENGVFESDLVILALALISDEQRELLIPLINTAIFKDKNNAYLYAALAQVFVSQGEIDLAIDAYESALGTMDDQTTWQMRLAALYDQKGELHKALSVSEKAIQNDPENVDVNRIYLQNLYQVHDYSTFIHQIEKSPSNFVGNNELQRELVTAYYETGQYRKALSLLNRIAKDPEQDLDMLLIQVKIATRLESIPKAMELIRKAYSLDPQNPQVIILLADIKSREQNKEFGLEIIEKALQSNIQSADLILEKTRYLEEIRGKKRALDFMQGYIEMTPEVPYEILNRYADLNIANGNPTVALHALETSVQQEDFQPNAHIQIGRFCAQNGDLDKAVFHFDKAIHMVPENMQAYIQLADVFLKRREAQRAEKIVKNALENCPEHYLIYEKASQVYNQLGDAEQAEQALRKAAALNPNDEGLREKLGIVLANRIFNKG